MWGIQDHNFHQFNQLTVRYFTKWFDRYHLIILSALFSFVIFICHVIWFYNSRKQQIIFHERIENLLNNSLNPQNACLLRFVKPNFSCMHF